MTKSRALNCLLCGVLGGLAVAAAVTACSDNDQPDETCIISGNGNLYSVPCGALQQVEVYADTTTTAADSEIEQRIDSFIDSLDGAEPQSVDEAIEPEQIIFADTITPPEATTSYAPPAERATA